MQAMNESPPIDYAGWHALTSGVIRLAPASDGSPGAVDRDTRTEDPDDELEPVLSRSTRATSARKRLLFLCASNVPEPEVLLNATDPWVTCVQYDFDQPLEQDSLRWIGAAAQRSAATTLRR